VLLAFAVVTGLGVSTISVFAQGDNLVTLCFRNRTVQVPAYLVPRYMAVPGTIAGPCGATQTGG